MKDIKKQIIDWIVENHEHHEGSDRAEMSLSDGKIVTHKDEYLCTDGNYPYVNSLELVRFIEQL
jgi:hypothetical protein